MSCSCNVCSVNEISAHISSQKLTVSNISKEKKWLQDLSKVVNILHTCNNVTNQFCNLENSSLEIQIHLVLPPASDGLETRNDVLPGVCFWSGTVKKGSE